MTAVTRNARATDQTLLRMDWPAAAAGQTSDVAGNAAEETSGKILQTIAAQPDITIPELATLTGVTERSIQRNLSRLQAEKRLCRIGPARGGHWQVVE